MTPRRGPFGRSNVLIVSLVLLGLLLAGTGLWHLTGPALMVYLDPSSQTPTPEPAPSPRPRPSPSPLPSLSPSPEPSPTLEASPSPEESPAAEASPEVSPAAEASPSAQASPSAAASPVASPEESTPSPRVSTPTPEVTPPQARDVLGRWVDLDQADAFLVITPTAAGRDVRIQEPADQVGIFRPTDQAFEEKMVDRVRSLTLEDKDTLVLTSKSLQNGDLQVRKFRLDHQAMPTP